MVVLAAARGMEAPDDGHFTSAPTDLLSVPKVGRDVAFIPIKTVAEKVSHLVEGRGASLRAHVAEAGIEASRFFPKVPYLNGWTMSAAT